MAATVNRISEWFDRGIGLKATHMIVVCDTFDHEDYPVFVKKEENVHEKESEYDEKDMQIIMEVYDLSMSKGKQLDEVRARHY